MQIKGKIYNEERAKQLTDFSGLKYERGITPTDVDGMMEFSGDLFFIIELKFDGNPLPDGQKLCFERVCDKLSKDGSSAAVIVADHKTPREMQIPAHACPVREYRWNGRWLVPKKPITVRSAIDAIKRAACCRKSHFDKVIRGVAFDEPIPSLPLVQSEMNI